MRAAALLLGLLALAGCDKLTGAADQKIADAEAVGFACRVAGKQPEACMKENEAQPPSSLLDGWKSADDDIKSGKLDPAMSNVASEKKAGEAPAEGEKKPGETPPVEGEAAKAGNPAEAAKDAKPEPPKDGKAETKHQPTADKKPAGEPKVIEIKPGHS